MCVCFPNLLWDQNAEIPGGVFCTASAVTAVGRSTSQGRLSAKATPVQNSVGRHKQVNLTTEKRNTICRKFHTFLWSNLRMLW